MYHSEIKTLQKNKIWAQNDDSYWSGSAMHCIWSIVVCNEIPMLMLPACRCTAVK
jgi:hypothetical protein